MMPRKYLGKTDIEVSTFGLGTVKFGRTQNLKYSEAFTLPSDEQIRSLIDCAKEMGVNFLDTAPAYGYSEERLGTLLRKERKNWVISTKVGEEFEHNKFSAEGISHFDFSEKHTRMSVERSLRRLGTDYLDLVLIHSNGEDLHILDNTEVLTTLQQLKQEGWIRALGMSTKTLAGSLRAAEVCDAVMLAYNVDYRDEAPAIVKAAELGTGILLKKVLMSGHLAAPSVTSRELNKDPERKNEQNSSESDPIQAAFDLAYQQEAVTSAIIGTVNEQHLRANLMKALSAQLNTSKTH